MESGDGDKSRGSGGGFSLSWEKNGTEVRWRVSVDGFFVDLHVRGLTAEFSKGV